MAAVAVVVSVDSLEFVCGDVSTGSTVAVELSAVTLTETVVVVEFVLLPCTVVFSTSVVVVSLLKVVEVTLFEVVEGFTAELVALVDVVVILLLPVVVVITVDSLVTAGETSVVLVVSITVVVEAVVELSALCEEGFVDVKAFGLLIPCVVVVLFNKDTVDSVAFEDELSLVAVVVGSVAVVVSKNNHSIEKYVRHERASG